MAAGPGACSGSVVGLVVLTFYDFRVGSIIVGARSSSVAVLRTGSAPRPGRIAGGPQPTDRSGHGVLAWASR